MSWQHYNALMYKNWILWKRRLGSSLCEILFPVLIFAALAGTRGLVSSEEKDQKSFIDYAAYVRPETSTPVTYDFPEGTAFSFCRSYVEEGQDWIIALAPKNDITEYLEEKFTQHPNLQGVPIQYFEDNDDVDDYVTDGDYEDVPKLCFAVVFNEAENNNYKYYIRYNQTYSIPDSGEPLGDYVDIFDFNTYDQTDEFIREPKPEFQEQFFGSGFIQIQNWVDNYILREISGNDEAYISAGFVPMYYDDWIEDDYLDSIQDVLPFIIILAFIIPVCRMISQIVEEKETKTKEMMSIMGLSGKAYWWSWISYYFIIYSIIALAATIILGFTIYPYSNKLIILVTYLLFGICCIAFSLFISVFFSRAKMALTIGLMVFLGMFFLYFAVNDPVLPAGPKIATSIFFPVAFAQSTYTLVEFEIGQAGVVFGNFTDEVFNYKYSTALFFLVLDATILFLLALYFEQVWPTEFGVKKPWNFLFKKDFWKKPKPGEVTDFPEDAEYDDSVEPVEDVRLEQKADGRAMLVRGLTKKFQTTTAVDNLNLDIFEGEIFALLGHNGAGKTTTISMLTGLLPVTSGDMKVKNLLLSANLEEIRKLMGVCPQQNVLYKELTPEEHLYLYSVFKGMTDKKLIQEQIDEKLTEVNLERHRKKKSEFLSGGQKRKLSLAIALIADSKIIILDEPTSGMDLTARRQMWSMLKNNKAGRIIILTTHYMQEADTLADRIAILSHGRLRCCGSSIFLKNRYGVGYYLTLIKEPDVESEAHSRMIEDFVKQYIPHARKVSDVHAEIAFECPLDPENRFDVFFEELDKRLGELSLRSYSISVTTLEEVFIRVARGDTELREQKKAELEEAKEETEEIEETRLIETHRKTEGLFFRHIKALLWKRIYVTRRDLRSISFEILIPIVLGLLGLLFMLVADRFVDQDPMELKIDNYDTPQDLLYPESEGFVTELMTLLDESDDITIRDLSVDSLGSFDEEVFEYRDKDPYRMGSYYFYNMDDTSNAYEPVVFHNQTAFQSVATFYQEMSLGIMRTINPDLKIEVNNYPLPITEKITESEGTGDGVLSALTFGLAFAFIPASIIAFVVKEREINVKHQHMISGVSLWAYWLSNFIWDYAKHLVVVGVALALIKLINIEVLNDPSENYLAIVFLFLLLGTSIIPFTYLSSYVFDNYATAQVSTILFHFVTGSIFPIFMYVLYIFDSTRDFSKGFRWVLRILPNYCIGNGLIYIGSSEILATFEGVEPYDALSLDSAGGDILMLLITSILFPILLILAETFESSPSLRQKIYKKPKQDKPGEYEQDEDVEAEKQRALNTDPADVQVNVRELRKVYTGWFMEEVVAVEDVSFNVPKRECFALLGVNGAGKSTTFKMLTGEYAPTSGEAYLTGYSSITQLDKARDNIGYCPQFDAQTEFLSCQEHIELYCEIKGIEKDKISQLCDDLLYELDLVQYKTYQSGQLSGGNRRKLQVAIALIGDPTVVFLDEPSSGMDPETRKKLWAVLGNIKKRDSAVVLTTHSMEEAEALSDRMSIMVGGRLRCIGTPAYLRDKFGQGYELEAKIKIPKKREVEEKGEVLDRILGENEEIRPNQLQQCLEALEAENLREEINEKGSGSALDQQMKVDGFIHRPQLVSWVILEQRGHEFLDWLKTEFEDVKISEHYLALYKFKIAKQEDKSIGYLFTAIERNKEAFYIADYAISQTTMDQIFTDFAAQGEMERAMAGN